MEKEKKVFVILTFFLSLLAIIVTVVSLATDNWVQSTPKLIENGTIVESRPSKANFGLFKGVRSFDYGSAARKANLEGEFHFEHRCSSFVSDMVMS